jgi:hypothetical protein
MVTRAVMTAATTRNTMADTDTVMKVVAMDTVTRSTEERGVTKDTTRESTGMTGITTDQASLGNPPAATCGG